MSMLLLAVGVAAGCTSGNDTGGMTLLRSHVPEIPTGVLYLSTDIGGSCTTDCPPASISRGKVVPCADLAAAQGEYETLLGTAAFEAAGDGQWTMTADNRQITVAVLSYDDASAGPQPTEQPYVDAPTDLAGACALVVTATVGQ
ncbi:MAG: hypothetical protein WCC60_12905 [Ilumatobacteraceae bacterium]